VDGGTEPAPSPTPEPEPAPKSPEPAPKKDDKSGSDEPKKDEPKDDKSQKKDEPKGDGQPTSPDIATPNPEDPGSGSGEGIDKDWWRGLPNASAIDVARAHGAAGWKVDERGETPSFSLGAGGVSSLLSVLTPPPIGVDPGGESLTLNLAGLHSRSMSTGTTTSDDWGDTPWNWAQAAAAPRI